MISLHFLFKYQYDHLSKVRVKVGSVINYDKRFLLEVTPISSPCPLICKMAVSKC